ncbi:PIN domain-containing protein [Candidatus Woesearchaeota archaeon]|nr:PIN domain-containing protein [Candidatus Woesearchaeota archaeon]
MLYIIDTHSWIEYLNGSEEGLILKALLASPRNKFITMECCVAELQMYCLRENFSFREMLGMVKRNSFIMPVTLRHWCSAAKIQFEIRKQVRDFGLIDAIIVYQQKEMKCKIVSGDPHFASMKNVIYTGRK